MKWSIAIVLAALIHLVGACDKGETKSGDTSTATTAADKKPAEERKPAEEPEKDEAAKVDAKALQDAYDATFGDPKSTASFDEKLKALKAKVGEPHKTEGKDSFWWAMDEKGKYCRELKVMKGMGAMCGMTKKEKCGK